MHAFPIYDWAVSVWIGWWVVSYWRSTWTLFDLWLCDQPEDASVAKGDSFCLLVPATEDPEFAAMRVHSARISYAIGVGCMVVGVFIIWCVELWLMRDSARKKTNLTAQKDCGITFQVGKLGASK
jgi:hypothetical protein